MDLDNMDNYYQPSFFTISLNTSKKYCDIFGSNDERHLFHEYSHFLEDISTTYGLACFSHVLNNIKSLYHIVQEKKEEGDFILCDEELDKITELNRTLFNEYTQYRIDIDKISRESFVTDCQLKSIKIDFPSGEIKDVLVGSVTFNNGFSVSMGEHSIMESISYILEKNAYEFSCDNYLIPYDLPYLVWKYYLPSEDSNIKALLELEEFSLQFYNPIEVFIKTLERIKSGEILVTETFYAELNNSWHSDDGRTAEELYIDAYEQVVCDINGTFVAPVYHIYRDWLLYIISTVKNEHKEITPLFAEVYSHSDKSNHTERLEEIISKFGIPPIINADGDLYIEGVIQSGIVESDWNGKINIWVLAFFSFLSSLAIYSVYSLIIKKEKIESCTLREVCRKYNELANSNVFDFDDDCMSNPHNKRIKENSFCPFSVVWQTFGLNDMGIF